MKLAFLQKYFYFCRKAHVSQILEVKLQKRHENALNDLLETVAFRGYASEARWRLARWYGQNNFTVTIRRDLRDRWKSLLEDDLGKDKAPVLRLAEIEGEILLIRKTDFFPDTE